MRCIMQPKLSKGASLILSPFGDRRLRLSVMEIFKPMARFFTELFREGAEGEPVRTQMEVEQLCLKDGKLIIISKTTVLDEKL